MPPIDGSGGDLGGGQEDAPEDHRRGRGDSAELAASWYEARDMADYWDERKRRFAGEVVDRLGPFRNAVTPDGHKVGRRQGVWGYDTVATAGKSSVVKARRSEGV